MVTDATWRDVDGDGRPDLVVVGEWMPVTVFHNAGGGRLTRVAVRGLEQSSGWWNRVVAGDFDGDGRVDFLLGNLGLNSRLRASPDAPLTLYVGDFSHDGFAEQVLCFNEGGVNYPIAMRDELIEAMPALRERFITFEKFASQRCDDLLAPGDRAGALVKKTETLASAIAHNNGDGSFTLEPLPTQAQLAPIYGAMSADVNGDGHTDLLLGGNFDGFQPEIGSMSASYGLVLQSDGKGHFTPIRTGDSGFLVPGQTRDIARVRTAQGDVYVVARNDDRPLVFRLTSARRARTVATR
jgi:hypothetical protein